MAKLMTVNILGLPVLDGGFLPYGGDSVKLTMHQFAPTMTREACSANGACVGRTVGIWTRRCWYHLEDAVQAFPILLDPVPPGLEEQPGETMDGKRSLNVPVAASMPLHRCRILLAVDRPSTTHNLSTLSSPKHFRTQSSKSSISSRAAECGRFLRKR